MDVLDFRAMAGHAVARGVISPELFQTIDEAVFIDESHSIIDVPELRRTYSRRLRRADESSPYFGEILRLLEVLDGIATRCDQVRLISVWLKGGFKALVLIDSCALELLYCSEMWISRS
jgi:hypothetical protein